MGYGNPTGILINASDAANASYLTVWKIDQPVSATPAAVRSTIKNLWTYDIPAPAPQFGGSATVDTGDTRVLKAVYRDGILFSARNTGYNDQPTTVTYDRIDIPTMKATMQARKTNSNSFYPVLEIPATLGAANAMTNKLITGTTTLANGTLGYPGISEIKPGLAYYDQAGGTTGRWGDFYEASIDPVTGGMWLIGEFSKPAVSGLAQWGTWAAYYPWRTSQSFTDVPSSSPYFDFINVMQLWGISGGCTATEYCPTDTVTRGQAAVFIVRGLFGENFTHSSTPYFTDVTASDSIFSYVQKMKELGITAGCTATTFCADQPMLRSQMAIFLMRAKMGALQGDNFSFPSAAYFKDVAETDFSYNFIQKLREFGITGGCAVDQFCPDATVTREQMAVFVVRAFLN